MLETGLAKLLWADLSAHLLGLLSDLLLLASAWVWTLSEGLSAEMLETGLARLLWADSSAHLSGPLSDLLLLASAWVWMLSEKMSADPLGSGSESLLGSLMEILWELVKLELLMVDSSGPQSDQL
mmetsp:Transcript_3469/g.5277  ORF Transcript_3469/g.5277 Transcript_3469/m.5277 type:complete len:125 (-) Transcript_3469:818-1192(-)